MTATDVVGRAARTNAVRVALLICVAWAALGCRHRDGQRDENDTNGPGALNRRLHDLSGPGVSSEAMRVPGGAAYSPWGSYSPANRYSPGGGYYGAQTWPAPAPNR